MKDGIILIFAGLPALFASSGLPAVEGNLLLSFLAIVGCGLWIWNQGKSAFGKANKTPQPLIIDQLKAMATREEVEALETKVEEEFEKQREVARITVGNVHKRIDKQSEKLGELVGKTNSIDTNVKLLLEKGIKS